MKNELIKKHVDYTILKAHTTLSDVLALCDDAIEHKTASVCIPPSYVKRMKEKYKDDLVLCTVIGFPLGYSTTETKIFEAKQAIEHGADEIDMVINIGDVKNGNLQLVMDEIIQIKRAIGEKVLKVIIETCYLSKEEISMLTKVVLKANAEFIKTSTGFGSEGATIENIKLIKESIERGTLKMKASGGIRSKAAMEEYLALGVDRLGVSSIDCLK